MKRLLLTLLGVLMISTLTACGSKSAPLLDDNGEIWHYPEEQITEGYWILKDDGYFYKLLSVDTDTDNNGNVFIWFNEPYDAAIPRFTTKDKLMFYSETSRPSSITLYKMTDYGYTLGTMFTVENNTGDLRYPQIIGFADKTNPLSPVGDVLSTGVTGGATTYITGINNHEFTSNLLVDDSFLKGLTKDTMYQIEMYCGTVRKTVNIKADTHLFLQESTYVTSSYEELKAKCFEVLLPANLAPGYYYANDIGMFYYEGTIKDIDDDDIDSLIDDTNDEMNPNNDEVIGDSDIIYNTPENQTLDELDDYSYGDDANEDYNNYDTNYDKDYNENIVGDTDEVIGDSDDNY